eukprot:4730032-Pyramimonas_sp.AAC.1
MPGPRVEGSSLSFMHASQQGAGDMHPSEDSTRATSESDSVTEASESNSHIPGGMPARLGLPSGGRPITEATGHLRDGAGTVGGIPSEGVAVGGHAMGIPMGDYGIGVVPGVPVPTRGWSQPLTSYDKQTPLCEYSSFGNELPTCSKKLLEVRCWCSCICPCLVYANNYTSFYARRGEECTRALGFCALCPGLPALLALILLFKIPILSVAVCLPMHGYSAWYTSSLRTAIRERYGIS